LLSAVDCGIHLAGFEQGNIEENGKGGRRGDGTLPQHQRGRETWKREKKEKQPKETKDNQSQPRPTDQAEGKVRG